MVEHNLAKVGVAGSSPVSRSGNGSRRDADAMFERERRMPLPFPLSRVLAKLNEGVARVAGRPSSRGGEIGRRARLKILWG